MADLRGVDMLALVERDTRLRKKANNDGGEYCGPCPGCGGKDRFNVWPSPAKGNPRYWCRQCDAKGDAADYLVWRGQVATVGDALKLLGAPLDYTPGAPRLTPPPVVDAPPAEWQAAAASFVAECESFLWSDQAEAKGARAWLARRGLTEETIRAGRLGYNAEPGKGRGPRGVTIPCYSDDQLWYVKTRRRDADLVKDPKADKYIHRAGCTAVALYNADALTTGRPVALVESELCALAIHQAAGSLVAAVATGTAEGAHRARWLMRLALAPRVLVALDNDGPGEAAAAWWLERLGSRAERWTPERKDPGDMLREDGPAALRRWIADGLGVCYGCGADVDRYTPEGYPVCAYHDVRHLMEGGAVLITMSVLPHQVAATPAAV